MADDMSLIEKAARAICARRWSGNEAVWTMYKPQARDVIAAVRQALEKDIMERCARICEKLEQELQAVDVSATEAAIRTSIYEAAGARKCAETIRSLVSCLGMREVEPAEAIGCESPPGWPADRRA